MNIYIFIIIGFLSISINAQELYYFHPIDSYPEFKDEGLYFPEHNLEVKNGVDLYDSNKLIFCFPLAEIYRYHFELFVDNLQKSYVIVTPILKRNDDYSGVSSIPRDFIYIIPLNDNKNKVFYSDILGKRIISNMEYSYEEDLGSRSGNLIKSIDLKNQKIKLLKHDFGSKPLVNEINIHIYRSH